MVDYKFVLNYQQVVDFGQHSGWYFILLNLNLIRNKNYFCFKLPAQATYSSQYWPDNGEIDLMEQVGYEPNRIHSTVHTKGYNHLLGNHPSHSVVVNDVTSDFKIYTLDWSANRIEMFVGNEANPLQQSIFYWNKFGDWTAW